MTHKYNIPSARKLVCCIYESFQMYLLITTDLEWLINTIYIPSVRKLVYYIYESFQICCHKEWVYASSLINTTYQIAIGNSHIYIYIYVYTGCITKHTLFVRILRCFHNIYPVFFFSPYISNCFRSKLWTLLYKPTHTHTHTHTYTHTHTHIHTLTHTRYHTNTQ